MKKLLIISIILLAGIIVWQVYFPAGSPSTSLGASGSGEIVFQIERGQGSRDIARNLQNEGLIEWSPFFSLYVILTGSADDLKAGTYMLSRDMNIPQIAEKFAAGDVSKEQITIIEGWSLRNIGSYLENKGIFPANEIQKNDWDFLRDDYSFLDSKPANVGLDGFLFPDTYEITKGISLEEIVIKMLDNFDKRLTPSLRAEIEQQGKTIFQAVTMASILEKEVQTKEDKEIVSGIFWKRIKLGMRLESDATIAYIKGVDQWRYSYKDTRVESPYNTYLNYGLPLGPISNPGMDSILAAIYPQGSEYLFFLSTPEGESIFSRTLEEHNIAKAKYLK